MTGGSRWLAVSRNSREVRAIFRSLEEKESTRIILVRHGETDWNKAHRLQGGLSDTPLNDRGKRQASHLAAKLRSVKIRAVYSSPLVRSACTAQAIARTHDLEVAYTDGLKEIGLGDLEGFPSARLVERFDCYIARNAHLQQTGAAGIESIEDVQKRAWETVRAMAAEHPGRNVVAVTHYFVIGALVCRVLGVELDRIGRLRSNPGTITAFTLDKGGGARLELFNSG